MAAAHASNSACQLRHEIISAQLIIFQDGPCAGPVTAVDQFATCTTIDGSASFSGVPATSSNTISASHLVSIAGSLVIQNNRDTVIVVSMPLLTSVAALTLSYNTYLTQLSAPALTYIATSLQVSSTRVTNIDLPSLVYIGANMQINYCSWLAGAISTPALTFVGGFVGFQLNPLLASVQLDRLQYVGASAYFGGNDVLTFLSMPALTYIGQYLTVTDGNPSLLSVVDLPVLTYIGAYLKVQSNTALSTLNAPSLAYIENIGSKGAVALYLCSNADDFAYSGNIPAAAASFLCYLPPSYCYPQYTRC